MKINYKLEKEDYIKYNLHFVETSKDLKKVLWIRRLLGTISLYLIGNFVGQMMKIDSKLWTYGFAILAGIWFVFYGRYFKWSTRRKLTKLLSKDENQDLLGEKSLEIRDEKIIELLGDKRSEIKFATIDYVENTEEYIYIYLKSMAAYVIPKRCITSEDDFGQVLEIFKDYIK